MKKAIITAVTLIVTLHANILEMSPEQIKAATSKINGNSVEAVMHKIYTQGGYGRVHGEVGSNGIDGLYVKRNANGVITDVLVGEAKYNSARIKGNQMTHEWVVDRMRKLKSAYPNNPEYGQLLRHMEHGNYRRTLVHMTQEGSKLNLSQMQLGEKEGGLVAKKTQTRTVDMKAPKNSFEQMVSNTYRDTKERQLIKKLKLSPTEAAAFEHKALRHQEVNALAENKKMRLLDTQTRIQAKRMTITATDGTKATFVKPKVNLGAKVLRVIKRLK